MILSAGNTLYSEAHKQRIISWRESPERFAWECFKLEPDEWQAEVFKLLADPSARRIAMKAAAGPGKSLCLSIGSLWFMQCFGEVGEHPQGIALSMDAKNLADNLWKEIAKWLARSELLQAQFEINSNYLYCKAHPDTWFISARTWNKAATPEEQGETLSGLHAKYVLILVDESGSIPPQVMRKGEQALMNCEWGKILQAGNPTSTEGMLYEACVRQSHLWRVVSITGDPDDPKRSPRIDIEMAREQIKQYGRDNPWVKAYILGQFPESGFNQLLGPEEVWRAMERWYPPEDIEGAQKRLGIDVARFGDDATCIFPRQGLVAYKPVVMKGARTGEIAQRVISAKNKWRSEMEFVDGTGGYGAGVCDQLLTSGLSPQEVNFAGASGDPRYFNKRSEMIWLASEWIKERGQLPKDDRLVREATAATYTYQNGKIRIEEKEQIKKRLGFSPDLFDALCLTFAMPDMPAGHRMESMERAWERLYAQDDKVEEYDPFAPSGYDPFG